MISRMVRVHAALLSVSLIYGFFYVVVKILFRSISPGELILVRFLLTALIVAGIDRMILKRKLPNSKDMPTIALLGLTGVFLVQILVAVGLNLTTAFHSALIMATIPIFTLMISVLKRHEPFNFKKLVGVITAFIGVVVLLMFSGSPSAPLPPHYLLGDGIVLLNALSFAWFLVGSQKILTKYSAFSFMAYCYVVSAGLFSVAYFGEHQIRYGTWGLEFLSRLGWFHWCLIAYVVLFASIGTYTLNNFALKRTSPSIVAIYIFIQPVISAVSAYYVLGERFTPGMGVAAILTFTGLLLATTSPQPGPGGEDASTTPNSTLCPQAQKPPADWSD